MNRRNLAMAAIALGGLTLVRSRSGRHGMPYAGIFQRELAKKRGPDEAERLVARAQTRYEELHARRPHLANRALRFHLERGILPGLALYQVLIEEGGEQEAALAEMEHVMASVSDVLARVMRLLGRLPDPFAVFRRVEPWVVRIGFPEEGWDMEPAEASEDCIAFNVRRCFYLDTLSSYGAPELTAVYCGGDDVTFAALPPSIAWERAMTLGRGHDHCDFRWRRVEPQETLLATPER